MSDRPTTSHRKAIWADLVAGQMTEIRAAIDARRVSRAFSITLCEMAVHFLRVAERADALEDRIAALEAGQERAPKPRVKVRAQTRART